MNTDLLSILQHSLGVDQYGQHPKGHNPRNENDGCGLYYRNYYVTDRDAPQGRRCEELVAMGFMRRRDGGEISGSDSIYHVTQEGMDAMRKNSPSPPKISRARQRYLEWLNVSDVFPSFGAWLKFRSTPEGKSRYV